MKRLVYNALFAVAYVAMLPHFLLRMRRRGGYRARMGDRFARYPEEIRRMLDGPSGDGGRIWVHAVSVGEVQVADRLMRSIRELSPETRFVFSTTSSTGWRTAEGRLADGDILIYNPLDFPRLVRRAFDAVRPKAVILAETEIWPNFIWEAARRGIPVFLANARISDRSAPRYRALRFMLGDVFRCLARIYAQSDLDAERLIAAGADGSRIEVTGSFKFDAAKRSPEKERELREWVGGGRIMLGGSTWPGEDSILIGMYGELPEDVKLVIAPRHFEKADAVERNITDAGYVCIRRSRGESAKDVPAAGGRAVFLADTTGELMGLYGIASAAFVGKSLCEHGSQNMIEPCLCGIPTFVGPYTENFRPVMSDLLAADAIVQVKDAAGLREAVLHLFGPGSSESAAALGERARNAVERRRGVVERCAKGILSSLR